MATEYFEQMKHSFLDKLSEEDKERYRKFGEEFYSSFDVETGQPYTNAVDLEEALAYTVESLKAGLHPHYLSQEERTLVQACYGETWYQTFGYESLTLGVGDEETRGRIDR